MVEEFNLSDQIRILAVAASELVGQNQTAAASNLFQLTVEKTKIGQPKTDPANRAVAVTANSLACAIEEKKIHSEDDLELILFAAHTARTFWEMAGTWLKVERAEYRLARSYLKANRLELSLRHAKNGLKLAQDNKAESLELFFVMRS